MKKKHAGNAAIETVVYFLKKFNLQFEVLPPVPPPHELLALSFMIPTGKDTGIPCEFITKTYDFSLGKQIKSDFLKSCAEIRLKNTYSGLPALTYEAIDDFGVLVLMTKEEHEKFRVAIQRYTISVLKNIYGSYKDGTWYEPERPHQLTFRYDSYSQRIVGGATEAEAKRILLASGELNRAWKEEIGSEKCPCEKVLGYRAFNVLPVFDLIDSNNYIIPIKNAFELPDLRGAPEELRKLVLIFSHHDTPPYGHRMRLAGANHDFYKRMKAKLNITLQSFTMNLFQLLRVAHKRLNGTFTDSSGSSIFTSNVALDGVVHDLETFHSIQIFPEDCLVPEQQEEDVRLAIEALREFCILENPSNAIQSFGEALEYAYKAYSASSRSRDADSMLKLCKKEFASDGSDYSNPITPFSGVTNLFIEDRKW